MKYFQVKPTLNKGCQARICTNTNAVQTDFDRQYEDKFRYFENKLCELEKNVLKLRQENDSLNKLLEKEQKLSQTLRTEMYTNEKVMYHEPKNLRFAGSCGSFSKILVCRSTKMKSRNFYPKITICQKKMNS